MVGVGGQLTYELFLFSQAQLLGGFDAQSWALRGFVYAGLVPLLGIGLSRLAREKPTLFVSRQMVFYTTAFLIVGDLSFSAHPVSRSWRPHSERERDLTAQPPGGAGDQHGAGTG